MVSNGLSRRRRTLKRPLVCKSDKRGECGDCNFTAFMDAPPYHVGEQHNLLVELGCDPDPRDTQFELQIKGPAVPVGPVPPLITNLEIPVPLRMPATPGTVTLQVDAINSDACLFRTLVGFTVLP